MTRDGPQQPKSRETPPGEPGASDKTAAATGDVRIKVDAEAVPGGGGAEPLADNGADTKEAEALVGSLNRSAEQSQTLWLSFLTFGLYVAIAAGTTTHVMLLRADPLSLPVLNIPLPLIGFYVLAPIIL
jgi:hypothetical protein